MNQLNVGDVVYLNSDESIQMTVAEVSGNEVECIYFNRSEQKFVRTMPIPEPAVTLLRKVGIDSQYR